MNEYNDQQHTSSQVFVERGKMINDIRPILEDIKDLSNPVDILSQNVEIPNGTPNNISLSREEIKAIATLFGHYIYQSKYEVIFRDRVDIEKL